MSIHSRAPHRIDFAGGWSDVADFAEREGGCVVNAAIAAYVHVDFLMGGNRIRLHAEDRHEHVSIASSGQIAYDGKLDLHKAALNMLPVTGGIEILSNSDVPPGAGLGGSGTLDVALLAGLARCRCEDYDPEELAEYGFLLETSELGLLGGKQDQYAAALGGFHEFDFLSGAVRARQVAVSQEAAADLARHLVLVYTGQSHFTSQTHARVWDAFSSGEERVVNAIRGLRDVARETGKVLEGGDWRRLAELVNDNWRWQQQLDATMSTPRTRRIEEAVRAAGAWGLKATGAGAGGCLLVFCPPDRAARVREAAELHDANILELGFAFDGVTVWQQEDATSDA